MATQPGPTDTQGAKIFVSTLNTTASLLGSNVTWTGSYESTTQWAQGDIAAFSDVGGTLFLDLSNDGISTVASPSFVSTGNVALKTPFNFQYVRLRYTNGPTPQTTFSLQTIWRPVAPGVTVVPFNSQVFSQSQGQIVRAILDAENSQGLGTFQHLQSLNNRLLVDTGTLSLNVVLEDTGAARQGKLYLVNSTFINVTTPTETDFFLLKNPSGSGIVATLQQLVMSSDENIGATYRVRVYKNPTITTNGTAVTPVNARQVGAAAVVCTTFRSPAISARGTLTYVTNFTIGNPIVEPGTLLLDPNNNYLVTLQTDNTANFNLCLIFSELAGI